jgi:hypothetical protein
MPEGQANRRKELEMNEPNEAKREKAVTTATGQLKDRVDALRHSANELEEALTAVLRPKVPATQADVCKKAGPICPHEEALCDIRETVGSADEMLRSILERLEV